MIRSKKSATHWCSSRRRGSLSENNALLVISRMNFSLDESNPLLGFRHSVFDSANCFVAIEQCAVSLTGVYLMLFACVRRSAFQSCCSAAAFHGPTHYDRGQHRTFVLTRCFWSSSILRSEKVSMSWTSWWMLGKSTKTIKICYFAEPEGLCASELCLGREPTGSVSVRNHLNCKNRKLQYSK